MERLAHYRKALAAFIPAVILLLVALGFDVPEELVAAIEGVIVTAAVFFVPPNQPRDIGDLAWVPRRQRLKYDDNDPADYAGGPEGPDVDLGDVYADPGDVWQP
jgi:hypothetical protein